RAHYEPSVLQRDDHGRPGIAARHRAGFQDPGRHAGGGLHRRLDADPVPVPRRADYFDHPQGRSADVRVKKIGPRGEAARFEGTAYSAAYRRTTSLELDVVTTILCVATVTLLSAAAIAVYCAATCAATCGGGVVVVVGAVVTCAAYASSAATASVY